MYRLKLHGASKAKNKSLFSSALIKSKSKGDERTQIDSNIRVSLVNFNVRRGYLGRCSAVFLSEVLGARTRQ